MKLFGLQITKAEKRSLENPRKSITGGALDSLFADSGVSVNEQTALSFSAVWAAVRVLSESVASLPLMIYERTPDGGRKPATGHPLYAVLHDEPNDYMTSFVLRETLMAHCSTWGNAYAFVEYNRQGRPQRILPLMPDRTTPKMVEGVQVYETEIDGKQVVLDAHDVLHISGLGFDGLKGYSPIRMQAGAIGLGMAATDFGAKFFSNGATPSGILAHPEKLSKEAADRLRSEWTRLYSGNSNAHKTAVLQEGMTYQQIGLPPGDAQFIESRKLSVTDVARIFRVPPHLLGDLERSTFSNIEHQSIEFITHSLRPWLVRWEQELNRKLLMPSEKGKYFIEHKIDALLRGDTNSRFTSYATARQWGWLSINDIRRLENLSPIPEGDDYLQPLNMAPAGQTEEPDQSVRSHLKALQRAACERLAASEAAAISRAQSKENFDEWATEYFEKQTTRIAKDLQLSVETVRAANTQAAEQLRSLPETQWELWRSQQLEVITDEH